MVLRLSGTEPRLKRPNLTTHLASYIAKSLRWCCTFRCLRPRMFLDFRRLLEPLTSRRHTFITLALDAGAPLHKVQVAAGHADPFGRHMFRDENPGAGNLAADGRTLQDAQDQKQDGGAIAQRRIGRQQAHQQGRHGHQKDAESEHPLAAQHVAEMRHDDAAHGPGQIAGGEDAIGLQILQPGKKKFFNSKNSTNSSSDKYNIQQIL